MLLCILYEQYPACGVLYFLQNASSGDDDKNKYSTTLQDLHMQIRERPKFNP